MSDMIRVLIADDHPVVREGLKLLIKPRYGMQVIGEACDGEETILCVRKLQPDVVLMDLAMPKKNGLDAIREIQLLRLGTHILVLTSFAADQNVADAIKAGANGFLLKDASPEELITAIRDVYQGKVVLSREVTQSLLQEARSLNSEQELITELTDREKDVLRGLGEGQANKEIAYQLGLASVTVRFHVSNILRKLQVSNRTQAALFAKRAGFVQKKDE